MRRVLKAMNRVKTKRHYNTPAQFFRAQKNRVRRAVIAGFIYIYALRRERSTRRQFERNGRELH